MDDATQSDAKWERWAALGGVAFVVLGLAGAFIAGAPPSLDDTGPEFAEYFDDKAGAIQASQFLTGLGIIGLVWWFGSLWRRMSDAEGGRPRLAVVSALGLAISGAMVLASGAVLSAVAMRVVDIGEGSRFFYALAIVLISSSGFGAAVSIAAISILAMRSGMLARWVALVGYLAAVGFLVASLGSASDQTAFGFIGLAAFVVWCIFILSVSAQMWKGWPAV
jgi:hypothetical protein